jgi:hypothetical protein
MDKSGGEKYTEFLLSALQHANSFRRLVGNPLRVDAGAF